MICCDFDCELQWDLQHAVRFQLTHPDDLTTVLQCRVGIDFCSLMICPQRTDIWLLYVNLQILRLRKWNLIPDTNEDSEGAHALQDELVLHVPRHRPVQH